MLYLVPTPIGNLSDMTARSIQVLKDVDLILAEDTRISKPLLKHFGIDTQVQSFHSHNEHSLSPKIIEKLSLGVKIACITDAGTPGISDPAYLLVHACRDADIEVIALPGATAFVPAIVASGLPTEKFFFQGFLPLKKGRKTQFEFLANLPCTVVIYESPHRLLKFMDECILYFGGERQCSLVKEISKMFEKHYRGTLFSVNEELKILTKIQGEWVMVIEGKK
jgi:16S rRNA (cytidine1402-2'-O)-methyltransferase